MQLNMLDADRHGTAELREQVRQLPSVMARLVFLAGLRDPNSGTYCAPLGSTPEGVDVDRVLRSIHEEAFSAWLDYRLAEQKADLDLYFSGVNCERTSAAQNWLHLESYRSLVPVSASSAERQLFYSDLKVLLGLMAHEDLGSATGVEQSAPHEEILMTSQELSRKLGISCRTLSVWVERHKIPAVTFGRRRQFSLTTLREWLCLRRLRKAGVANSSARPVPFQGGDGLQRETRQCKLRCSELGVLALSAREHEVLNLIGEGRVTKQIAASLSISANTIGVYRKRICKKLGLHSTSELAACAVGWRSGICRRTQVQSPIVPCAGYFSYLAEQV
jgi:excisionase family DNA binding protein